MGAGVSLSVCQSSSAVQVRNSINQVAPDVCQEKPTHKIFGVSLSQTKHEGDSDIPVVIKQTAEYLTSYGLDHKGLFRINGSFKQVMALKAKYDAGETVDLSRDADIDTVSSLLKLFLRELPEGLIPEALQCSFIRVFKEYRLQEDECNRRLQHLIRDLSPAHFNVFHYLCTFVTIVASYSDVTSMTIENLSVVLGPSFFRVPFSAKVNEEQTLCNQLLLHLLKNFEKLTADRQQSHNIQLADSLHTRCKRKVNLGEDKTENVDFPSSTSEAAPSLQDNSFSSTAVTENECESPSFHEDQTISSKLSRDDNNKENYPHRATELEENAASSRDLQHHVDKKMFDGSSRHGIGILQSKQPKSGVRSDIGKIHEGIPEIETVSQCLPEIWTTKGMTSHEQSHISMRGATDFQSRNSPIMRIHAKDIVEQMQLMNEEEAVQPHGCRETSSSVTQTVPGEVVTHAEPVHREPHSDSDHGPEDTQGCGTSRLLFHITDGDNPLLSPRCAIFSQSQRFNLDPESAPSPPSSQQFMMPRSSSRGNCEDPKEPLSVIQLTKQIQNLKRKIRKFEDRFEQEKNYRPSHSDKTSNVEVLKWMNDLAKARKQLKELKLKLSEDHNVPRATQNQMYEEISVNSKALELHGATSSPMSSVEETVETVWKRLKEKRQLLNLPDNLKDMTKKQMSLEKMSLQKCLLYFENIHGRPVTKQERSLIKPLYDRYRIIKQLLSTATLIPTIHEEEDSEDDSAPNSYSEFTLTSEADLTVDEHLIYSMEDPEPAYISPLDEKRSARQPALSMSNLHEASMSELLDHLRETRADKKRLRKALREFEEHFLRQTGRTAQKEDRIPMAEEYCEYKQIKAKLRLLEVLISKQDVSKTI
ncbi:protein FAM13C isoform X1 [Hyperolius riggenbachi]|uniref:protein FAM13C isoform X1 n=1 Tax=Hyperolius riggenbachi TaxID=752182 RepID=UPI0035A2F8E3